MPLYEEDEFGLDVATNSAPSTLDALEPDEILRKIRNRQSEAEAEYNSLIRQSKLPTDRYSPSQAFGASALAVLPFLAAYAFGGDDKYANAAAGALAGKEGAEAYLGNIQKDNARENELAGLQAIEVAKQADDLRGLETTATQASLNAANYKTRYDLMARNQSASAAARGGGLVEMTEDEKAGIDAIAERMSITPEERQLVYSQPTPELRQKALGELRRSLAQQQSNTKMVQNELPAWETSNGVPMSPIQNKKGAQLSSALSLTKLAISTLREAIITNDSAKQNLAIELLTRAKKDRANAGASFTDSEQKLYLTVIPAFLTNAQTPWSEVMRQRFAGLDPVKMLDELERGTEAEIAKEALAWNLVPRKTAMPAISGIPGMGASAPKLASMTREQKLQRAKELGLIK